MPSDTVATHITTRELHSMEDFATVVELEQAIWGKALANYGTSPYIMNAAVHNGGVVIGAELNGKMVGMCFGFAGKRGSQTLLWSHMAGVHPDYQDHGIGYQIKQAQRMWALENGYDVIAWTFDPMQRGNANFNFNRLGVIARTYYVNHYGDMADSINVGLASDRLEAWWRLNDPHVIALAAGHGKARDDAAESPPFLVRSDSSGIIWSIPPIFDQTYYAVEIPYHIAVLKQTALAKAIDWQRAARETMQAAFVVGYVASDFVVSDDRCWYVVSRE